MRVLLWPTYSYPGNVQADSLYLIARNLIRANPDMFWYLPVPAWAADDGLDDLDVMLNVEKYPIKMPVLYRAQEAVPDRDVIWRFAPQDGNSPVEAVISMSPQRMPNLVNAWSIRSIESAEPVFVNWDLLVRNDRSGEMTADEIELIQMAMGYAAADLNVFESPIARKMAIDMCRKYLAPARVKGVLDSSVDVWQGIPVNRVLNATEGKKRDRFTVYYGGRLSESKRFEDLAEVVRRVFEYGRDIDFVITTGSIEGQKLEELKKELPFATFHVGLSQEDAWRVMGTCHTSLCFSSHELFGMAFWEQMVAGLPVVMKAADWNYDLLPEGYQWIAYSNNQAAALLIQQYEAWRQNLAPGDVMRDLRVAEHIRDRMDSEKNLRELGLMVQGAVSVRRHSAFDSYEKGGRSGLSDLVDVVVADRASISWAGLVDGVREASRIGKGVIGNKLKWARSNAMLDLYRLMLWKGWVDMMDEEDPIFVKERS